MNSFPVWKWQSNSCAYDALLAIISFGALEFPQCFDHPLAEGSQRLTRARANVRFREEYSGLLERIRAVWLISEISNDAKITELTQIRNQFRELMYPLVGLDEIDGMRAFAGFDDLFAAFSTKLLLLDLNTSQISSSISSTSSIKVVLDATIPSLSELTPRNGSITERTRIFMLEFPREAIDEYWESWERQALLLKFRHNITNAKFTLIGVVDYNRVHYRFSLLLRQPITNAHGTSLKPGVYLVDPHATNRCEWVGTLPTTSRQLKNRISKFTSPTYKPHGLIYLKTKLYQ